MKHLWITSIFAYLGLYFGQSLVSPIARVVASEKSQAEQVELGAKIYSIDDEGFLLENGIKMNINEASISQSEDLRAVKIFSYESPLDSKKVLFALFANKSPEAISPFSLYYYDSESLKEWSRFAGLEPIDTIIFEGDLYVLQKTKLSKLVDHPQMGRRFFDFHLDNHYGVSLQNQGKGLEITLENKKDQSVMVQKMEVFGEPLKKVREEKASVKKDKFVEQKKDLKLRSRIDLD